MRYIDHDAVEKNMSSRLNKNSIFKWIFFAATTFGLLVLAVLLYRILTQGFGYLSLDFLQILHQENLKLQELKLL